MRYRCHVCGGEVVPDARNEIRLEGVTFTGTLAWEWGPVVVHEPCRLRLETPFDNRIGVTHTRTWQKMHA